MCQSCSKIIDLCTGEANRHASRNKIGNLDGKDTAVIRVSPLRNALSVAKQGPLPLVDSRFRLFFQPICSVVQVVPQYLPLRSPHAVKLSIVLFEKEITIFHRFERRCTSSKYPLIVSSFIRSLGANRPKYCPRNGKEQERGGGKLSCRLSPSQETENSRRTLVKALSDN